MVAAPDPMVGATILHVDMDAFFASVEALENPELRNRPLIVGGDGARGVVASCSYEARFYGVRSAMPSVRAKRLCPSAVFVHGRYHLYEQYSRRMHAVFAEFTPLVEGISLDEAFLDVAGAVRLFGRPAAIAAEIRDRLRADLGLTASVGVGTTKHIAKLASVAAKPKATAQGPIEGPGVFIVEESDVRRFLDRLPVRALWGVGPKSAERLAKVGIETVAQLVARPVDQLALVVGKASAQHLNDLANNVDPRPVVPSREAKSVSHEQTYAEDLRTDQEMSDQFLRLGDAVAGRLRSNKVAGRTLTVKVRFATFRTITRSKTLPKPFNNGPMIARLAADLTSGLDVSEGIRLLGVSMSNLEPWTMSEQLTLDGDPHSEAVVDAVDLVLDDTIDKIRERFGKAAVMPAPMAGQRSGGVLRQGQQQWGPSSAKEKRRTGR